ncbi:MAG TPA: tripartite tricarboxylate transporter substrate binding protein [Burkholderiales bacterium]|jgi:tripartite-type tricarboxylate transporter receptor subunit TctC
MRTIATWIGNLAIAGVIALGAAPAAAQVYPAKAVRVIVPFPAGGGSDILARAIAEKLTAGLGQQFLVDNRSGAGGALGTELAARAPADGYTIIFSSSSALVIGPNLVRKPPYDPLRDFAAVTLAASAPNVLVIHPSLPARSVRELISLAKRHPGELNFASNGVGTLSHLTGELLKLRAGVDMLHVPYKGGAPAVIDTVAGHTSALFAAFPTVAPQVRAGRLRALAVSSARRAAVAPELPTVAETLPGFESSQWWAVLAPAGTAAGTVSRLNAELQKVLAQADVRKRFAADAAEPIGGTPAECHEFMRADYEKWGKLIGQTGLKPR